MKGVNNGRYRIEFPFFKAAVDKMIATSEESYKTDRRWGGKTNTGRIRTYTQEEVQEIIESGNVK